MADSGRTPAPARPAAPLYRRAVRPRWDVAVAALLVLLVAYGLGTESNFGDTLNISFLLGNTTTIAIVALPMTLLVAAGERCGTRTGRSS